MKEVPMGKTIGGKSFQLVGTSKTKKGAQRRAKQAKDRYKYVRVVKCGNRWAVYKRK